MLSYLQVKVMCLLLLLVVPGLLWSQDDVCYETKVYYEKVAVGCGSSSGSSGKGSSSSSSSNGGSSSSSNGSSGNRSSSSSSHGSFDYPSDPKIGKKYISFLPRDWSRNDILPPRFILPIELLDVGVTDYFTNDQILAELWRRKGVGSLVDKTVEYQPPKRVQYNASYNTSDLDFRRYKLDKQDHKRYMYIIIPSAGIVAPVSQMPHNDDFKKAILGKKTSLREYMHHGTLQYPRSENPGEHGNFIVAGHSAEFKTAPGRYKTAFTSLPLADKGDSVYVYVRQANKTYKKFEYIITKSYNTSPKNVGVLNFRDGKNMTLFTCTPIGGLAGRWIVEAVMIPE